MSIDGDRDIENLSNVDNTIEIEEIELSPLKLPPRNSINWPEREEFLKKLKEERRTPIVSAAWRIPLRVVRLLIVVGLLPAIFLIVPLYMRYWVFSGQMYPLGMSDMRIIDKKVSTTWCQRQVLRSNATFNAFRTSSTPSISDELIPVSMTRQLYLKDDMKEYWGFYLLQGSNVTVSSCCRWPGASLIMIRGHKHLQDCAYIGDDSSEELEEILRYNSTLRKLSISHPTMYKKPRDPSNRPDDMTRHAKGVEFHENRSLAQELALDHMTDERDTPDSKDLQKILNHLKTKKEPRRNKISEMVTVPQLTHRHRDTNINQNEGKNLKFKDLDKEDVEEAKKKEEIRNRLITNEHRNPPAVVPTEEIINYNKIENNTHTEETLLMKKNITEFQLKETEKEIEWEVDEVVEQEEQTSSEIFEDIFVKLTNLGVKGKNVLNRLNKKLAEEETQLHSQQQSSETHTPHLEEENLNISPKSSNESYDVSDDEVAEKKIQLLKQLLLEIIADQRERKTSKSSKSRTRSKRDFIIKQHLEKELNEPDEKGNVAVEEGFEPDEIADDHSVINETTPNDMSGSEFWSSFSSSEEALLECDGLILNLPLIPTKACEPTDASKFDHKQVSRANTVTYSVPMNGYYFFVFNSENEVQENYIRVKFDMQKTIYDLKQGAVTECENSTGKCEIPLAFFSQEKVVLEVPVRDNDSLWNEEFVVFSECEPRTSLYLICVIAIPVLVIVIAFQ